MGIHIKANKKNLQEAIALSLRGKLNEVYTKEYIETFDELYDSSWGPALQVLDKISEADLEDNLMDWLEDLGTEDNPIDRTELNDYIIFQSEDLYDALGLDENGDPLDESKKLEARSHKEDNERVVPRTSIEKEYMHNNANFSIYDSKDNKKFNQDSYKEPINAKRNKIRNYKDTETITHTSYEKSPNKQTQLYKDLKDLGYIKSNKKVNEGIFNKKQKDKKQSTILDDHPELVDLFKTKDMSRLGRAGWEPSKQEKTERHKTEAKLTENRELTQNNAELMCEYIADLFTNESEDLYSNFESFTDWCEGGDVFRNADFPEDKCRELDKMLKEIAPLVDEVSNILYKYVDKD